MATITSFEKPGIRGFLHRPESGANGDGLVLTHGAGGHALSPLLAADEPRIAAALVLFLPILTAFSLECRHHRQAHRRETPIASCG